MVVHCAGVMNFAPADPFADMLQPVVLGTLNLLTAAKAAKTVEKFVIVSCVAAVHDVPDAAKVRADHCQIEPGDVSYGSADLR